MTISKNFKAAVTTFFIGVLIATTATAALAAIHVAEGSWKYFYVSPYSYKNNAVVWSSDGTGVFGETNLICTSDDEVPTGYLGARAMLFCDDSMVRITDYDYNDYPCAGILQSTSPAASVSGTYYSYGITRSYNGNGYTGYDTNLTPNLNY